jgi:hypothetical protein
MPPRERWNVGILEKWAWDTAILGKWYNSS